MTTADALTCILVGIGCLKHCACCNRVLPVSAFAVCTPSVNADGEPYRYQHRRGECESCRKRRLRIAPLPMEAALGIVIPIRPARDYRRQAA